MRPEAAKAAVSARALDKHETKAIKSLKRGNLRKASFEANFCIGAAPDRSNGYFLAGLAWQLTAKQLKDSDPEASNRYAVGALPFFDSAIQREQKRLYIAEFLYQRGIAAELAGLMQERD